MKCTFKTYVMLLGAALALSGYVTNAGAGVGSGSQAPKHTIKPENWTPCAVNNSNFDPSKDEDWSEVPAWTRAPHLVKLYERPRILATHGLCNEKFKRIVLCLPGGAWMNEDGRNYTDEDWVCAAVMPKLMKQPK